MKIKAYAKINWHLAVIGRRADGYHELDMVMQRIDLFDLLDIEPAEDLYLNMVGDVSLQADESNLVLRAARALQSASGFAFGARMTLHKSIPLGAGLGGGSADAAAALRALNNIWGLACSTKDLQAIGLTIGADIPYCLESGPAHVHGIGEFVKPFPMDKVYHLVILKTQKGLRTKEVFALFDTQCTKQRPSETKQVISALNSGDLHLLKSVAYNDLQAPAMALLPDIQITIDDLYALGAEFAQMSGSGSAVYGAFLNQAEAHQAYEALKGSYAFCHMCSTFRA